jgi:hypothetical protein
MKLLKGTAGRKGPPAARLGYGGGGDAFTCRESNSARRPDHSTRAASGRHKRLDAGCASASRCRPRVRSRWGGEEQRGEARQRIGFRVRWSIAAKQGRVEAQCEARSDGGGAMAGQKWRGSLGFKGRCTGQSRSQAQSRRGRLGGDYVAAMLRPRDPGRDPSKQRWTGCSAHQGLAGVYGEAGSKVGPWRGGVGRQVRFTASALIPCLPPSGSRRRGTPGARSPIFENVVVLDGSGAGSCSVSSSVSVLGAALVVSGDGTLGVTRLTVG